MLDAKVSAHCNRVAVEDGHTECVSIKFRKRRRGRRFLRHGASSIRCTGQHLPTAPENPVQFEDAVDRPQPRLDRMRGAGMAATVGRLRECPLLDWKFVVLSHNTIRGAAGAAVLNAEVLARLGKLKPMTPVRAVRRCWYEHRARNPGRDEVRRDVRRGRRRDEADGLDRRGARRKRG